MAHGFNELGKSTSFASRRELAWHGLGKTVDAMTSEEAIVLGGMDFEVDLAPVYAGVEDAKLEEVWGMETAVKTRTDKGILNYKKGVVLPNNFATYRTDNKEVFGVVGKRYTPIQNKDAFAFFDSIIGEGHAKYETVGALGNGRKVFITAKLPNKLVVGKENIDKYLLLTMAHDGSGSVQAMFTPIRVVCNNTLSAALSNSSNKVSIRHTKNALDRLNIAKRILGIADRQSTTLSEVFTQFAKTKMNDEDLKSYFKSTFKIKPAEDGNISSKGQNILNNLLKYHEIGIGQRGIEGTAWGAYNAVTGYQQNIQKYRNTDVAFDSMTTKGSAGIRQAAFDELLTLI